LVANAAVSAEVVRQIRGEKLISFKYRPKARSRVKKGHRQELTVLRISDITLDGKSAAESATKAHEAAKTERQRLEEAAEVQAGRDAELAAKLAVGTDAPAKAPAKVPAKARTTQAKAEATSTRKPVTTRTSAAKAKPTTAPKISTAGAAAEKPKRPSAKAAADAPAKADTPKRSRAPKKDE
jgi:ribosomal L21-like protein